MNIKELQQNWNELAERDPLWAILSDPDKTGQRWELDDFMATGRGEIADLMSQVASLGLTIDRRRALDFGCGVGRLTQALGDYFEEATGVDISPEMVTRATTYNRHGRRCHYYVNSRPDLSRFESGSFDLIYSVLVLQHIPPRYSKRYLEEFLRLLAPAGVLVFQLPSADAATLTDTAARLKLGVREFIPAPIHRLYRLVRCGRVPPFEIYGMTAATVMHLLHARGARVLKIESHEDPAAGWIDRRYFVTKKAATRPPEDIGP